VPGRTLDSPEWTCPWRLSHNPLSAPLIPHSWGKIRELGDTPKPSAGRILHPLGISDLEIGGALILTWNLTACPWALATLGVDSDEVPPPGFDRAPQYL